MIAPTWNDEFELPDGSSSLSDIQVYTEYIIKKHETLTAVPPIHVYINRINNILVFEIKDGYKLELQTPETVKLFGSAKKMIDKTKNGGNAVNINKSLKYYVFTPNKFCAYLLSDEPSNLVFLKTYNTKFDEIIITFTDQNGRPLEIKDKVNLALLINK